MCDFGLRMGGFFLFFAEGRANWGKVIIILLFWLFSHFLTLTSGHGHRDGCYRTVWFYREALEDTRGLRSKNETKLAINDKNELTHSILLSIQLWHHFRFNV